MPSKSPQKAKLWRIERSLGVTFQGARLWRHTLANAHGSITLSERERRIMYRIMLAPHTTSQRLTEILWNEADAGPDNIRGTLSVTIYHLRLKLKKLKLNVLRKNGSGSFHCGVVLENLADQGTINQEESLA